jgi:hypothetical protein
MPCFDCSKTNYDEAYLQVKQEAKKQAIETNEAQAIWKEENEWWYGPAAIAIADGKPIREFVSAIS